MSPNQPANGRAALPSGRKRPWRGSVLSTSSRIRTLPVIPTSVRRSVAATHRDHPQSDTPNFSGWGS